MVGKLTRRAFSQGYLAVGVAAVAIPLLAATRKYRAPTEWRMMAYQDRLAELFDDGEPGLSLMAMAHIGGFARQIPTWMAAAETKKRTFFDAQALARIFDALLTADAEKIEAALRHDDIRKLRAGLSFDLEQKEPSMPAWLDHAISLVARPLILLGRADLLPILHDNSLRRLGPGARSDFTVTAALALAEADEWPHALQILERARQNGGGIPIYRDYERVLWKFAYLHRRVETAMPVLSEMPFSPDLGHLVEYRKWQRKAYEIRAGVAGERVPIIEGKQPPGYDEAAAMQIAALADDPSAADYVHDLARAVNPRTVEILHADRGLAFSSTNVPMIFLKARTKIAARRKDYQTAAALARLPFKYILFNPPNAVIDAFLDERDWRNAAAIADEHDPRQKPVIEGFDDTRMDNYIELYQHLALAAAHEGDDSEAAAFIAKAKAVDCDELRGGDAKRTENAFFWLDILFAGLAENLLPRKYLYVLTNAFRSAY